MPKGNKGECSRGKIKRKAHWRSGYINKDGTKVQGTHVKPSCVNYRSNSTKKRLLPQPDKDISLSSFGYNVHKSVGKRREALMKASQVYGIKAVKDRMNLIRNLQSIPENKKIFTNDVEYMKKMYLPYRKTKNSKKQSGGSEDSSKKTSKKSSNNDEGYEDHEEYVNLSKHTRTNFFMDKRKICNENNCKIVNIVCEEHIINGKHVIYRTLEKSDVDQIIDLDKLYLNQSIDDNSVLDKIIDNPGLLIGIEVDGKIEGYCQYKIFDNLEVELSWFCSNKGYATSLYIFVEKYFKMNDFIKIITFVNMDDEYFIRKINFWYNMGFLTYRVSPKSEDDKSIFMEKYI